jgi:hypothetical protein
MTRTFKERQHYHFIVEAVHDALHSEAAIDNFRFINKQINGYKGHVHRNWLTQGRLNGYPLGHAASHLMTEKQLNKLIPLVNQAFPVVIAAIRQARVEDNHVRSWDPLIKTLEDIQDDMGVARGDE